jgi:hypothetical protein
MIPRFVWRTAILLFATGNTLSAENIDINKFQEVNNGMNHGRQIPADVVYLKADATEGQKGDAGVVPAIKMGLSQMPKTNVSGILLLAQIDHLVMQDITTAIVTKEGSIGVDVWASPDFKRTFNNDPNGRVGSGDWNGFLMTLPDMDFWIMRGSQHTYFSYLKPGAWTHVEGKFITHGHFEFHVPPGTGFVYLKDFVAKP